VLRANDSYGPETIEQGSDPFFVYPSRTIDKPHPSIPHEIADDWLEAQTALSSGNPKAAAVMVRRVLYSILQDRGCKLFPLKKGIEQLLAKERLPTIFDEWLPAIKEDGDDAAHPERALFISTENVTETLEYTSELLRFLYIEPYDFQQRKQRNTTSPIS
jgi:hypothetical protein